MPIHPEQQQEAQDIERQDQFMAWFNSEQIHCSVENACFVLNRKLSKIITLELLQQAYYWEPPPEPKEDNDEDYLPF